MEVKSRSLGDVLVIELIGEIDGRTAPDAQAKILALADKPGCKIVLDMGGVPFMSSAGLRLLLMTYRKIVGKAGKVVLVNIPQNLADTMSVTGFLDLLPHRESIDAGVAALA